MDLKLVFLQALAEPEYSRVEFWQNKQKESNFSENVFWLKLNDYWKNYSDKINGEIDKGNAIGNSLTNWLLPLLTETQGALIGHIGLDELSLLYSALVEYGFKNQLLVYYYEYDLNNINSSGKSSPANDYKSLKLFNEHLFITELGKRTTEEIADFLNFHLRCFERKKGSVSEWLTYTKKRLPTNFSLQQKDAFYRWFENIEGKKEPLSVNSLTPITKVLYLRRYAEDSEVMNFYENCLKSVKPTLSLNTGLKELPAMFLIIDRWNNILKERLVNAPSSKLATELFKEELKSYIEYDENADIDDNHSNYWNKFRKIGYEYHAKGQNITLQGLGYLFLRNVSEKNDGIDFVKGISNVFDVEGILVSLAEGTALAEYLHSDGTAFANTLDGTEANLQIEERNRKGISNQNLQLEFKPTFKPEAVQQIFDLLKDFFEKTKQPQFKQLLETGENNSKPLIFLDNGNRLADAFKQLIKADIITGCEQKQLEKWICENFKYKYRNKIKVFAPRYVNDIISTNKDLCKKPILNVKKGVINKV